MENRVMIAGFGGQGVMVIGQLLGFAACDNGKKALFLAKYGPEQRGGTASCTVTISEDEIGAPVTQYVDVLMALNQASLEKYYNSVKPNGAIIINSSLCAWNGERADVKVFGVDANKIANELGSDKVSNIVMIGAYISATKTFTEEEIDKAIKNKLGKKVEFIELNEKALKAGMGAINA